MPDTTALLSTGRERNNDDLKPLMGVRGLCSMFIILGHFFQIFSQGQPGSTPQARVPLVALEYLQAVTLFFLLSGVALSRFYSRTRALQAKFGRRNFMAKRVARLTPSYYMGLLVGLPSLLLIHLPQEEIIISAVLSPLFMQAWYPGALGWNGPLWQVSAFMFCYFVYVGVEKYVRMASTRQLWAIATVWYLLDLAALCVQYFLFPLFFIWIHVSPWIRVGHFFCGVVLGELVERQKDKMLDDSTLPEQREAASASWGRKADVCSLLLALTLVGCEISYREPWYQDTTNFLQFGTVPLLAYWIAALMLGPQSLSRRFLTTRPLRWLGEASFAIYCIHFPLLIYDLLVVAYTSSLPPTTLHILPWWHIFIILPVVIGLGSVFNKYCDSPVRKFLQRKLVVKPVANLSGYENINA